MSVLDAFICIIKIHCSKYLFSKFNYGGPEGQNATTKQKEKQTIITDKVIDR